ncbi:hypothetical protein AVEN_96292-1 [Araneus ventricosus]|uniref:Uncharacterized protein n=1 Tax=Araneus ventricosus TaxID=182803 RepID=A0A4Y2NAM3_ARAVE|nr:hypothetical protein AVEN_96292-1 [Araneus ventricosus]
MPYLYAELSQLLGEIVKKIVKPEKIVEGSALLKLDLNSNDNLLEAKNIDIGFGAKKYLKELKIADKTKLFFFLDCQKILQNLAQKIIDKSPLKYKIIRGLSSLHPSVMLNNSNIGLTQFNIVLEVLHNANQITATVAERGKD